MNNRRTMMFKDNTNLYRPNSKTSFKGSTSSINLNSTSLASLGSSCSSYPALHSQAKFDELELQHAYKKYLQTCLKEVIVNNEVNDSETIFEDQLSIFSNKAGICQQEEHDLQEEIKSMETQTMVTANIIALRAEVDIVKQTLSPQVRRQIDLVVDVLDLVTSKLYLKNIEPIVDQNSFDELEKIFVNFSKSIKQLLANAGSGSGLEYLKNALVSLTEKQSLLQENCLKFAGTSKSVAALSLKNLSDLFCD